MVLNARDNDDIKMRFDFPITGEDNIANYIYPSMESGARMSKSFYNLFFLATDSFEKNHKITTNLGRGLFMFLYNAPLSVSWLHEEYHIQSLKIVGLYGQKDEINEFKFSNVYAVYGPSEEDLNYYKKNHSKEWIRSHSAGYEAYVYFTQKVDKDNFFNNERKFDDIAYPVMLWAMTISNQSYLKLTTSSKMDESLDKYANDESSNPNDRDLRGYDFTTWVYDMFRPNLTFDEARLNHPNGGKLRGVKYSQLNDDEKDYLDKQYRLSFLNYIDPSMFMHPYFDINEAKASFNFKHYLAPFGSLVDLNIFYKKDNIGIHTKLSRAQNYENNFYGMSVGLIDYPIVSSKLFLSADISIFSQPKDLTFKTNDSQTGFKIGAGINYYIYKNISLNADMVHKSKGFVVGTASLERTTYLNSAISFRF
jgi:hypothetical protein